MTDPGIHPAGCRFTFAGTWAIAAGCDLDHPTDGDIQQHSAPEDWQRGEGEADADP